MRLHAIRLSPYPIPQQPQPIPPAHLARVIVPVCEAERAEPAEPAAAPGLGRGGGWVVHPVFGFLFLCGRLDWDGLGGGCMPSCACTGGGLNRPIHRPTIEPVDRSTNQPTPPNSISTHLPHRRDPIVQCLVQRGRRRPCGHQGRPHALGWVRRGCPPSVDSIRSIQARLPLLLLYATILLLVALFDRCVNRGGGSVRAGVCEMCE